MLNRAISLGRRPDEVHWSSHDESVAQVHDGVVSPVSNGTTKIIATIQRQGRSLSAEATLRVKNVERDETQWEFSRHVLPVLSKAGCNSGACHGALAGKGGFRLSLRGYNPKADYYAITQHAKGRRVELADPGRSLLIAKPSMTLPHKGGIEIAAGIDGLPTGG